MVVGKMMILTNNFMIRAMILTAMQRELRILKRRRGIRKNKVVQHRHLIIQSIRWEW
jgi:hypothetical protein